MRGWVEITSRTASSIYKVRLHALLHLIIIMALKGEWYPVLQMKRLGSKVCGLLLKSHSFSAELDHETVSTMFSLLKQSITTFLILELIIQVSIEVVENI